MLDEPRLVVAQLEVIVLFLETDHLAPGRIEGAVRAAVLFGQKGLFPGRVEALIDFLVEMAFGVQAGEDGLHDLLMAGLGSADEVVVGEVQFGGEGLPDGGQFVAVNARGLAFGQRRLLDLLPVLIQAGQEIGLDPQAAPPPGDDVGDHFFVSVAQVRPAVDVINGRCNVEPLVHSPPFCSRQCPLAIQSCARRGGSDCRPESGDYKNVIRFQ